MGKAYRVQKMGQWDSSIFLYSIIKALNYGQPSPAQPAFPEKKSIIFMLFFRQRYSKNVKLYCSKNEKIKLFSQQRYSVNVYKMLMLFSCFFPLHFLLFWKATQRFKNPTRDFHAGFTINF